MNKRAVRVEVQEPVVLTYDTADLSAATVFSLVPSTAPSSRKTKKDLAPRSGGKVLRQLAKAAHPPAPEVRSYDRDELATPTVFAGAGPSILSSLRAKTTFRKNLSRRTLNRLAAS